jgi:hypothetical protein
MPKYLIVFLVIVASVCNAQTPGKTEPPVLVQAKKMVHALQISDFDTFDKYTNPALIDTLGGKEKYNEVLQEAAESLAEQNLKYDSIKLEQPSEPVKCNKELQCVIAETVTLTREGNGVVSTYKSYLIGISSDGGTNWNFINADVSNMDKLKAIFPNICDSVSALVK